MSRRHFGRHMPEVKEWQTCFLYACSIPTAPGDAPMVVQDQETNSGMHSLSVSVTIS